MEQFFKLNRFTKSYCRKFITSVERRLMARFKRAQTIIWNYWRPGLRHRLSHKIFLLCIYSATAIPNWANTTHCVSPVCYLTHKISATRYYVVLYQVWFINYSTPRRLDQPRKPSVDLHDSPLHTPDSINKATGTS